MAAKVLTVEAAKAAKIDVVENGKYTQVVHDTVVALRAIAAAAPPQSKTKATVNGSGAKPWRQKGTGPRTRRLQVAALSGSVAALSSVRIRATIPRRFQSR